jgi:predicted dienelactone hydrolase
MTDRSDLPPYLRPCFWLGVLVLALLLFWACGAWAAPADRAVGFQHLRVEDSAGPPLEIGLWYPADAPERTVRLGLDSQRVAPDAAVAGRRLPLVILSHGNGGWYGGHADTAIALARAGFVVAAPTHAGDNFADQSRATDMEGRVRQLVRALDWTLTRWEGRDRLDPRRVGAFGFSAGGFTVLTAAGGEPDLGRFAGHCARHPDFYDCALARTRPPARPPFVWAHDRRIRAVAVAAPALGFSFEGGGLKGLRMPVQLWRAERDAVLPSPFYVEPVAAALPRKPELHVVEGAGHFDFLQPCAPGLAAANPQICASAPGFDRVAFHERFNAAVVGFFRRALGVG